MKKYILYLCSFFIATQIAASHMYHTQGVVKNALGHNSPKIPVYNSPNSNSPTGDIYIKTESVSGYNVGTFSHTARKKTRKGTFNIVTSKKNVIQDDAQHPLAQANISGATKNIIGFVRNPYHSLQTPANPKNIPLYEYTGTLSSSASPQTTNKK